MVASFEYDQMPSLIIMNSQTADTILHLTCSDFYPYHIPKSVLSKAPGLFHFQISSISSALIVSDLQFLQHATCARVHLLLTPLPCLSPRFTHYVFLKGDDPQGLPWPQVSLPPPLTPSPPSALSPSSSPCLFPLQSLPRAQHTDKQRWRGRADLASFPIADCCHFCQFYIQWLHQRGRSSQDIVSLDCPLLVPVSIYLTLGRMPLPMCRMQGLSQRGSHLISSLILSCTQFLFYSNWRSLCYPQCLCCPAALPLVKLRVALRCNGLFPPSSTLLSLLLSQFGRPLV